MGALGQLSSLRKVTVSTYDIVRGSIVGYGFNITYTEDVGDVAALSIEFSAAGLSSIGTASWVLYDGDNSVTELTRRKVSDAVPGERPKNYMSALVDKDLNSYTISGLVPGQGYYASVSAVNAYGTGSRILTTPSSFTTPKQAPSPPIDVTVDVNPGSTTDLQVSFAAPLSDGGNDVLSYRIELDTTSEFVSPLDQTIMCPSRSKRTVWQVSLSSSSSYPIYQGSFALKVKGKGLVRVTKFIPFDAVATFADELGISTVVSVEPVVGTPLSYSSNSTVFDTGKSHQDLQSLIFPGNRLKFVGQKYSHQEYVVNYTKSYTAGSNGQWFSAFIVNPQVEWSTSTPPSPIVVNRVYGGRGSGETRSRIACGEDSDLCYKYSKAAITPSSPSDYNSYIAGSIQAAVSALSDIAPAGVSVDRSDVDSRNGLTWRITFLDDSPAEPLDFKVEMNQFEVRTTNDNLATYSVSINNDGEVFSSCVGNHIVPDKALDPGQFYYARVFAENEVGFSLPQSSLSAQKPMVVPGSPTSVVLSVYSETELRVTFNPPVDDGGDTITAYMIEYSTDPSFPVASTFSTNFTNLAAPAPFSKKITNLVTGTYYFVRVKAMNSRGYGISSMSVPSSLNPFQTPEGPTNVLLRSTSNSMLTVSFDLPVNDGGDPISSFRVEWDTDPRFNSVRVFAKNSATLFSAPTLSSPISARPQLNVPGKPHTIIAGTGDVSGTISVSWQAPFVPWHQIPCSGTVNAPQPCPTDIGGGNSAAFGGGAIVEYQVTYNELEDFSGFDSGSITTTLTFATITGLTRGRKYYIKVLARNFAGASSFCPYTDQYCLDIVTRTENVASATAKV